jgi:hypothetical protein
MGIVDQMTAVFATQTYRDRNKKTKQRLRWLPFLALGYPLGALVSIISFVMIKFAIAYHMQWLFFLVAGGLLFSLITVFQWGKIAFGKVGWIGTAKSLGFVLLVEGSMTACCFVPSAWGMATSILCLALLAFINGTATTCNLILDSKMARAESRAQKA